MQDRGYWLSWMLGAAILAAVVVAAVHVSEEIFRGAPRASGSRLPLTAV
jgi:hypothetical protein